MCPQNVINRLQDNGIGPKNSIYSSKILIKIHHCHKLSQIHLDHIAHHPVETGMQRFTLLWFKIFFTSARTVGNQCLNNHPPIGNQVIDTFWCMLSIILLLLLKL